MPMRRVYPIVDRGPHIVAVVVVLIAETNELPLATVPGHRVTILSGADLSVTPGFVPVNTGTPVGVVVCETVDV